MRDSSWDTYTEAPTRRRKPLWAKFLMGCGVAAFLLVGSCVGFVYWATHSGMKDAWGALADVTDAVQTDEGALALYRDNPLLKADYPTEEDFLKSAADWRGKLADFPRSPPPLGALVQSDFHMFRTLSDDSLEMDCTLPNGARVRIVQRGGALAEIDVQGARGE
jgi:hypothetical protein